MIFFKLIFWIVYKWIIIATVSIIIKINIKKIKLWCLLLALTLILNNNSWQVLCKIKIQLIISNLLKVNKTKIINNQDL